MNKADKSVLKVSDAVSWVGILDYEIVTFDIVMETEFGTTYNSYFINSEKPAVIEGVKSKFSDTWIEKLTAVTNPSGIEFIILNHTEPDHSGSVGKLLDIAPEATVVGPGNAIRYLGDMIGKPFKSMTVKDGATPDLGN